MIFDELKEIAKKNNHKLPTWLDKNKEPEIKFTSANTKGKNILLLHGLFGAVSNWDSVFDLLKEFSNPIALSFPISTGSTADITVSSLTLLTEFFIRKHNLKNLILCGNSLGGHIALKLLLVGSKERVDKLILSGSSGLYEHTTEKLPLRPKAKFVEEQMEKVFYDKKHITKEGVDSIVECLADKRTFLNYIIAAKSAKHDNLEKVLENINKETLLLWGEDDEITPLCVANTFNKLIKNSQLKTIKNCGHAPMIERPKWFAEEIRNFVS
ncbi:MAG: alpha/beta fold hydrolase [Bdellovibrionota bacterium]